MICYELMKTGGGRATMINDEEGSHPQIHDMDKTNHY
jgi:hypothetical protein